MKTAIILISLLFLAQLAWAGAPDCTDVTDVTSGNSYTAAASDCIIRVNLPFSYVSFEVNLPEDGGTFKVQNGAAYAGDQCDYNDIDEVWICYPRAITIYSLDRYHNDVDHADSVTENGMYIMGGGEYRTSDTFTWDGSSNWDTAYDVWYP